MSFGFPAEESESEFKNEVPSPESARITCGGEVHGNWGSSSGSFSSSSIVPSSWSLWSGKHQHKNVKYVCSCVSYGWGVLTFEGESSSGGGVVVHLNWTENMHWKMYGARC